MIYINYKKRRPQGYILGPLALLFTVIISMIFRKPAYLMLMILDDTSTIKAFTDDTNTMNVEYLINKELHIINIRLKTTYRCVNYILLYNVNPTQF